MVMVPWLGVGVFVGYVEAFLLPAILLVAAGQHCPPTDGQTLRREVHRVEARRMS